VDCGFWIVDFGLWILDWKRKTRGETPHERPGARCASHYAPRTAWRKMRQPLCPASGLAQDAPATMPRERFGEGRASHGAPGTAWRKLSTLPPLVRSGEARKPDGIFMAGRLVAISGEIVTAENEGRRNWPEPFHLFWRIGCDLGVATRFHKLGWRDGCERWRLGPAATVGELAQRDHGARRLGPGDAAASSRRVTSRTRWVPFSLASQWPTMMPSKAAAEASSMVRLAASLPGRTPDVWWFFTSFQ
jgi:hypothetical protein